jgi:hypothetical protein
VIRKTRAAATANVAESMKKVSENDMAMRIPARGGPMN